MVKLEDMQQEEGSQSGQRTSSKKNQHQGPRTLMCLFEALRRGPWLTHGKAKVIFRFPVKAIKKSNKTRYYLCNPWSKPMGSRVGSKGEVVWLVGDWFLLKVGSRKFPLVHIFAWNAWTGKLSSSMCMTSSHNFLLIVIFNQSCHPLH